MNAPRWKPEPDWLVRISAAVVIAIIIGLFLVRCTMPAIPAQDHPVPAETHFED